MTARPLLIHPGLHKTATSWLQEVPFADGQIFNSLLTHSEVDALITRPHAWKWDPRQTQDHLLAASRSNATALVDVVSSEILTGNPFFGSREVPEIATRLKEIAPNAKILLTVREQQQWLRALYQQYVKRGGRLTAALFFSGQAEPQYSAFDYISLEYDRFAAEFASAYGPENVLVLPQELLRSSKDEFFKYLSIFLQVGLIIPKTSWNKTVGRSPPLGSEWLLRLANLFRDKPLSRRATSRFECIGNNLERLAYRLPPGRGAMQIAIPEDSVRASNLELQKFCPVDLKKLGYLS